MHNTRALQSGCQHWTHCSGTAWLTRSDPQRRIFGCKTTHPAEFHPEGLRLKLHTPVPYKFKENSTFPDSFITPRSNSISPGAEAGQPWDSQHSPSLTVSRTFLLMPHYYILTFPPPPLPRPLSSQELPPGLTPSGEGASLLSQGSQFAQLQKNLGGFLVHLHCQTLTLW